MKLEENYILKSDSELLEELQHCFETLKSTVSEEQEAYIRLDYRGEILLLKEIKEDKSLLYSYYSTSAFEILRVEIIEPTHPLYRNFIVNSLKASVEIYDCGAFLFATPLKRQLEGSVCIVEGCRIEEHHLVIVDDTEKWQKVIDEREVPDYVWSSFDHDTRHKDDITFESFDDLYMGDAYDKDIDLYANWNYDVVDLEDLPY